ncbi:hypothetical protein SDC9_131741 [bioreactor metagenome]|uniref:Uncharacterized protein n=1 Tax=bioreactor metagenome TaxID=1076179 RepID=A0A645D6H3_9ZZZZ
MLSFPEACQYRPQNSTRRYFHEKQFIQVKRICRRDRPLTGEGPFSLRLPGDGLLFFFLFQGFGLGGPAGTGGPHRYGSCSHGISLQPVLLRLCCHAGRVGGPSRPVRPPEGHGGGHGPGGRRNGPARLRALALFPRSLAAPHGDRPRPHVRRSPCLPGKCFHSGQVRLLFKHHPGPGSPRRHRLRRPSRVVPGRPRPVRHLCGACRDQPPHGVSPLEGTGVRPRARTAGFRRTAPPVGHLQAPGGLRHDRLVTLPEESPGGLVCLGVGPALLPGAVGRVMVPDGLRRSRIGGQELGVPHQYRHVPGNGDAREVLGEGGRQV